MNERTKCDECGGKIVKKTIPYTLYETKVGEFPAEICQKCGEICFEEEISKKITLKTKELGLWGLEAKTKIGKVGDALDVRFSRKIEHLMRLKKGMEVFVRPEGRNKILIELAS